MPLPATPPEPTPPKPGTPPWNLRLAEAVDAQAAAHVIIAARAANRKTIPPMAHPLEDVVDWFTNYVMANFTVWVADCEGEIVATMVLGDGWVEQLYVLEEFCSLGIGAELIDIAKAISSDQLQLWTFVSNVDATRFYQRHGFIEAERTDGQNEEQAPDIRFVWTGPGAN